ncbi:hypothetical protein AXX17_AT5G28250 [Arabidopsis thaliana]|uniref:Uncharacterized protein n=1 Tax=Arabidopsis thaliana TaxID=3702 RepID=A0A178UEE6_ARATH|nr:hypothetical protein AXX17_AT5G28250 [Arabidopsis thaliana]
MEGFLVLEESVHASEVKAQQLVLWVESLLNAKNRRFGDSPDRANNNMESEDADPDKDGVDPVNEDADEALDGEDEAGGTTF